MTGNSDGPLTIDTHHHILPDFFWRETGNSDAPVGGLAPLRWSRSSEFWGARTSGADWAESCSTGPKLHAVKPEGFSMSLATSPTRPHLEYGVRVSNSD